MKELTLNNLEVLNVIAWYNQLNKDKLDAIPMKIRFNLKKFMAVIANDAKSFEEFRDAELKKIQDKFGTDEKSYEREEVVKGDDGEPILDENGNEQTRTIRKVKDEYFSEYEDDVNKCNEKLAEILNEKNTYKINSYDIDSMVDNLPDDTPLEFDDINILDAIFSDNNGEA